MVRPSLRVRAMIVSTFFATCLAPATQAADMPFPGEPPALPEGPVEWGSNWYLRGDVGAAEVSPADLNGVNLNQTFPNNWTAGLGGGFKFNEYFRADVTVDYQSLYHNSAIPNNTSSVLALANAYLDLGTFWGFTPYIGAGVGANVLEQHVPLWNQTFTRFAYAFTGGVAFDLTEHWKIDLNYRYANLGYIQGVDHFFWYTSKSLTSNQLRLGFRYVID
jgi:opacity protein-like surface antigen